MSILETKELLRKFRIVPKRHLGQNFVIDSSVFSKLAHYASLKESDIVLDVGAGFGFLSRFLAKKCKSVISIEKDSRVSAVLREQVKNLINVKVIKGDILETPIPSFNKVISCPPYQISSRLLLWLFKINLECAALVLQKEFASRLISTVGSKDYGWLSVAAFYSAEVKLLDLIPKHMFYPQPEVDSVIVFLKPWRIAPFHVKDEAFFRLMVRWLFTQRNKKLSNALEIFIKSKFEVSRQEARKRVNIIPFHDKRVRELPPEAFGELANVLVE